MAAADIPRQLRVAEVIECYGACLELVPIDRRFHNISVGLYVKDEVLTVWSFSRKPGVEDRVQEIRDQLVALGGVSPVEGTGNQAKFLCGHLHRRPLRFLLQQAVGKDPDYRPPAGEMSIKDTKTKLLLGVTGHQQEDGWAYQVSGLGEHEDVTQRLRMVVAGFVRYGEMERIGDLIVKFPCGTKHDRLMRLLLPYSRNVSVVESKMEKESLRGQMTTGTLGFSTQ